MEIASVVPSQFDGSEDDKQRSPLDDPEQNPAQGGYGSRSHAEVSAALDSEDTPFFHFDLTSAVRAAELSVSNNSARVSVDFKQKS